MDISRRTRRWLRCLRLVQSFLPRQVSEREGRPAGGLHLLPGTCFPGVYARAYLEGRFDDARLNNFRHELRGEAGLSSYPHPWLMKDFWQFPTVSMGIGPLNAIYQARFMKYLENRGLIEKTIARSGRSWATAKPTRLTRWRDFAGFARASRQFNFCSQLQPAAARWAGAWQ